MVFNIKNIYKCGIYIDYFLFKKSIREGDYNIISSLKKNGKNIFSHIVKFLLDEKGALSNVTNRLCISIFSDTWLLRYCTVIDRKWS